MPKNRQQIPRAEKSDELLTAATELFLKHGYAGTTMADISASAGVARGNVYWYFASKDDMFAAVMDRMLEREALALAHELRGLDPLTVLVRGLADMRTFRSLHQEMHNRMQHSIAVLTAHDRFLTWIRSMVDKVVDDHHGLTDRAMVCDIAVSVFEGANVGDPALRPAHEMIRYLLSAVFRDLPEPVRALT